MSTNGVAAGHRADAPASGAWLPEPTEQLTPTTSAPALRTRPTTSAGVAGRSGHILGKGHEATIGRSHTSPATWMAISQFWRRGRRSPRAADQRRPPRARSPASAEARASAWESGLSGWRRLPSGPTSPAMKSAVGDFAHVAHQLDGAEVQVANFVGQPVVGQTSRLAPKVCV